MRASCRCSRCLGARPKGCSPSNAATVVGSDDAPLVDPEALALPGEGYDLIVSLFDLQVVNDVPGFLARIRRHLVPDGLFMAAAIGGDSLTELRQAFLVADSEISGGAFARVAPFIPLADAGGLLQRAGFALPVTDVETHTVRYADPFRLMQELKSLGAQNPLADRPTRLARRDHCWRAPPTAYARTRGGPRRSRAGDARNHLDFGLGAARQPAEAGPPRQRHGEPEGCA